MNCSSRGLRVIFLLLIISVSISFWSVVLTGEDLGRFSGVDIIVDSNGTPGEIIYCGSRHSKLIAITIDDGWVDDWELLNLLAYYKIKCTVFIPGRVIVSRPYFVVQLARMGFEIGNHTYSHHILDKKSVEEIREDIKACEELIVPISPGAPKYFRPSSGIVTENVIEAAKAEGYIIILWNSDIEGYRESQSVEEQVALFKSQLLNGNIVLSHFGSRLHTAKVLAQVIPELKKEGYRFVTVSELLEEQQRVIDAQTAVEVVGLQWLVQTGQYFGPGLAIRRVNFALDEVFEPF